MIVQDTYKETRVYRDATGRIYPSTSSVLDLLFPSKMEWINQSHLNEGTRCHEDMRLAMQHYLTTGSWIASANPRAAALIEYLSLNGYVPLEAEQPKVSEAYGHAGTPDALLSHKWSWVLADWKFAEGLDLRYQYQVQAYRSFFDDIPLNKIKMILFRVDKDCNVRPQIVQPRANHWTLFLNALAVMQFRLK